LYESGELRYKPDAMGINSTRGYHRNTSIDLLKEYTICESLSEISGPYMKFLENPKPYGAIIGDFLIRRNMLGAGARIMEIGGGYGSLMNGLLQAHGSLVQKVFMVDLCGRLLRKQREKLRNFQDKVSFIQADVHDLIHALRGVDLIIMNEVIGDLDTLTGINPGDLCRQAFKLISSHNLPFPREETFCLNIGAIRLVEAICSKGIPAFISEHSSDPVIPEDMSFLTRDLDLDSFPREIRLSGHSEYTIRFSHLLQVAESSGKKPSTGSLLELVGIKNSPAWRFIFLSNACSTDEQAAALEFLDHIREYRWLTIT
jgi:hypothetical protein